MARTAECAAPKGNQDRGEWMTVIEMQEYMRASRKDLRHALVDGVTAPLDQVRTDKGKLRVAFASQLQRSILALRNLEEAANLFQGHYQQRFHPVPPLALTASTCYKVIGGSLSYLQVPGESPGYFFIQSIRSPHWPRSSASSSTRAATAAAKLATTCSHSSNMSRTLSRGNEGPSRENLSRLGPFYHHPMISSDRLCHQTDARIRSLIFAG